MFISENIVPTLHERDPAIVHSIGQHTIGVEVTLSAAHLRHNVLRSKIVQGWVSAQLTRFVPLLEIKRGLEHEREKGEREGQRKKEKDIISVINVSCPLHLTTGLILYEGDSHQFPVTSCTAQHYTLWGQVTVQHLSVTMEERESLSYLHQTIVSLYLLGRGQRSVKQYFSWN